MSQCNSVDPAILSESLEQLNESLAKFKRANKAQRQKLGGIGYKAELEAKIARHTRQLSVPVESGGLDHGQEVPTSEGEVNSKEPNQARPPSPSDIDVDDLSNSVETLVDTLPYLPLQNFKITLKEFRSAKHKTEPIESLKTAWQALQTAAARNCEALGSSRGGPAWPGPRLDAEQSLATHVGATASWLSQQMQSFKEDTAAVPEPVKEKRFRIWDRQKGSFIEMTDVMCLEARTNPSAHIGCIEEGSELVLRILTNRNKNQKCLSCEAGGRSQSTSSKGQALRGDGLGFLNKCRCPLDTVLTEFWMFKVTASDPKVPKRDDPGISSTDFALNPISLRLIGAAIEAACGLTTEQLFLSRRDRLEATIRWAMNQMADEVSDEQGRKVKHMIKSFEKNMEEVEQLDED